MKNYFLGLLAVSLNLLSFTTFGKDKQPELTDQSSFTNFYSKDYYDSLYEISELNEVFEQLEKLEDILKKDYSDSNSVIFFYEKIRYEYASGNFLQTIKLARIFLKSGIDPSSRRIADTYVFLGNSYFKLFEYAIAIDYYIKASDIFKEKNLLDSYVSAKNNIALVYEVIKDYPNAIEQYKKSIIIQKENNSKNTGHTYTSIARIHIKSKSYKIAKNYLDSGLNASETWIRPIDEAYTYWNYGWYYRAIEQYNKSQQYYKKSLDLYSELSSNNEILELSILLSDLYQVMGEYEKSVEICTEYIQMAERINNVPQALRLSENLFDSYVALLEYKSAIDVETKYQHIKDSAENSRVENIIFMTKLRSEAAAEVELLRREDEMKNQAIQSKNILLSSAIIGIVLLIIIIIIVYRAFVINKKLSEINKMQAEKLIQLDEAKSRFFANISHDLKTPLSLMMGNIEQVLLNEDSMLTERGERQLKTGLQNGHRIIHLTNEINELIKMEDSNLRIEKKYINLNDMLELFVTMFSSTASMKGIKLSYSRTIFDEAPIVSIDMHKFEKVIFNLLTNALKHTKRDDSVSVTLSKPDDSFLELSVIDTGEGIPAENVPYIFERYYQAPTKIFKTQQGFGIGLALVKEITDKHGATISVKSKENEGSQFTVRLALEKVPEDSVSRLSALDYSLETRELFKDLDEVEVRETVPIIDEVKIPEKTKPTELDKNAKKPLVLIVEDHPEVRQYIRDIIETQYDVITAYNGRRALKVLETKAVDLIITDLMMPWFDGFELLEKLKENEKLSKIPVLVLSARTSEEDKHRVLSHGVNDFLHKPFNTNELLARIKNLMSRKNRWNSNDADALFINNTETLSDVEKSILKKVEELIMANISDPGLSVKDLAHEIAVSERKFFRMIKKLVNSTPFEYIKEIRLQYAKKLIEEKKIKTSSELAKYVGMSNVSHFNEQFKKRFGKKPTEML